LIKDAELKEAVCRLNDNWIIIQNGVKKARIEERIRLER
jgi:hypothetical protein